MNIDLHGFGPALAAGTLMTVKLALSALCLGLVLGLLGALAKTSPFKPLRWIGGTYSTIVRGVPELLWVLFIYFGSVAWSGTQRLRCRRHRPRPVLRRLCHGSLPRRAAGDPQGAS